MKYLILILSILSFDVSAYYNDYVQRQIDSGQNELKDYEPPSSYYRQEQIYQQQLQLQLLQQYIYEQRRINRKLREKYREENNNYNR